MMRSLIFILLFIQANQAYSGESDLRELLKQVKQHRGEELTINREREARFKAKSDQQKRLLAEARAQLAKQEARSLKLRETFDQNEKMLVEREDQLSEQSGVLNELTGVARQMAGETQAVFKDSMISVQYPGRGKFLHEFTRRKALPTLEELENIWFALQEEMTESGAVIKFNTNIIQADGTEKQATVSRVGPFVAVADGLMLKYQADTGKLVALPRQPSGKYVTMAAQWEQVSGGEVQKMIVDPTRGTILELLTQTPSMIERIHQGGLVGYIILVLGAIGIVFALLRYLWLSLIMRKIKAQMEADTQPDETNPLGRILFAASKVNCNSREKIETVLDEAILREVPVLERGNGAVKLLAAVAPMLGLLGTVTGMIATFQVVSLFGTGDPKLMAGGISQALMTTLMGLGAAIPLLFVHSLLASRCKTLINILDEQSAGLIARRIEQDDVI